MKIRLCIITVLTVVISSVGFSQWQGWQQLPDMPTARFGHCSVVYQDKVWNIGGKNQIGSSLKSIDCFNLKTKQWEANVPPLLHARFHAAAVVYNGRIFVIGGHNERQILNSVEYYDPSEQQWKEFAPLLRIREGLNAIVFEGKLYVLGGLSIRGFFPAPIDTVEFLDEPTTETWQLSTSWRLLTPRMLMQSVVIGRYVYTLGGLRFDDDLDSVERFATNIGSESFGKLPTSLFYFSAVTVQNIIYVLGGIRLDSLSAERLFSDSIHFCEPEQNKWFPLNIKLPTRRAGFTAVTHNNEIYIFGGLDSDLKALRTAQQLVGPSTGIADRDESLQQPTQHELLSNYPNPFNSVTTINFQIAKVERELQLVIFNLMGNPVRSFQLNSLSPGNHQIQWDGRDENGRMVESGIYLAQLRSAQYRGTVLKLSFIK